MSWIRGAAKTLTLPLGDMPNDRQANAGDLAGTPHLGLKFAPAGKADGSGDKGVVVVAAIHKGRRRSTPSRPAMSSSMSAARWSLMPATCGRRSMPPSKAARNSVLMGQDRGRDTFPWPRADQRFRPNGGN
jgi:hypothetical protein